MRFAATGVAGCTIVELDRHEDNRGFFARSWCADEFREAGLPDRVVQCSISFNRRAGTVRGMHLQIPPSAEGKLVRCTRGAIFDAIVDLRSGGDSFLGVVTAELDESSGRALFVPPGCAHGFQTLRDETEVLYMMTDVYQPGLGRGFRWDDPAFSIEWPLADPTLNDRDRSYDDFEPSAVTGWQWT